MKKILSVLCALAMMASFACIGASAADAAVSFDLVAAPVLEGDTTLSVDLVVTLPEGATGFELGSFGLDMNYDNTVMELAEEPSWEVKGNGLNSENVTDLPYLFLWVSIKENEQFKVGSTVACKMTFNLKEAAVAGTEYKVELTANEENPIASMASKDGAYAEVAYTAEQLSINGATVVATIPTTPEVTTEVTTTVETPAPVETTTSEQPKAEETKATTAETTVAETTTAKAPAKAPQTGDMMFVVAVVMVAVLGAAVVVKKVNVK